MHKPRTLWSVRLQIASILQNRRNVRPASTSKPVSLATARHRRASRVVLGRLDRWGTSKGRINLSAIIVVGLVTQVWAAGPFEAFAGSWRGKGRITLVNGSQDSIACKADYVFVGGGNALAITVHCASDGYKVDLLSRVEARGDTFSGSWQETTRQIQGDVTGRIPGPGIMQASLATIGGGIQLGVTPSRERQAIAIQLQGSDIRNVDIDLRKR